MLLLLKKYSKLYLTELVWFFFMFLNNIWRSKLTEAERERVEELQEEIK